MKHTAGKTLTLLLALVLPIGLAWADDPSSVETSTMTIGATTIEWDSSINYRNYTAGDAIALNVTWTATSGAAEFSEFFLRSKNGFTPPKDVDGAFTPTDDAEGNLTYTDLHPTKKGRFGGDQGMGNAHLVLLLNVDTDGDTVPDLEVGFPVDVHVCTDASC